MKTPATRRRLCPIAVAATLAALCATEQAAGQLAAEPALSIHISGQTALLSWFGEDGVAYQLESSPDLMTWSKLGEVAVGTGAQIDSSQTVSGLNRGFFRLKRLPAYAFFDPGTGILTVIGNHLDNAIAVGSDLAGNLRVNDNEISISGGTPTVVNTTLIRIFGRAGHDQLSLDETNGVLPAAEISGEGGNDTLVGGTGGDLLNGGPGNDSLSGKGGADFLLGGENDDLLTGGDGEDRVVGDAGNDRVIWNPGDDTELNEGGDGTDTVEVNGGSGAEDFTVTANGTRVRFDRINPAPFFLDIGTCESLLLHANGGNDTLSCTGNLAALIQLTANGGAGDDTLLGTNGADLLNGGDNNDLIDGQQGNDVAFLGAGDDTFQWDPGDGSDTVEGQAGSDTQLFNGSAGSEIFDLSANGPRARFTRNIGSVVMDLNEIENLDLNALGGADSLTTNDLSGTGLASVDVNLASTIGGNAGDAQADLVIVNSTYGNDAVIVTGSGGAATVTGLATVVTVTTAEVANDRLAVNVLEGQDDVQAGGLASGVIGLTINGGAGDDLLVGSGGVDLLNGDDDNDTITGGGSNDTVQLGFGIDRFIWNPGDDTDLVEGGDGSDTVEVNGASGAEDFTVTANSTRVRFDRINPAPFFLDIGTCESLVLNANGGNDTLSCTGNLAALIQLTANGGAGDDTLLGTNGADLLNGGDNNDLIDGQQGNDVAFLGAGDDTFQWDPGDGSDTVEGQAGSDTLLSNGSAGSEIFDLSANGPRARFTRNIGSVVMDLNEIENLDLNALGGADSLTTNDLSGTSLASVDVSLASTIGGNLGDAQLDSVTVNGTASPDTIALTAIAATVQVSGLAAQVRITGSEVANDDLIINGLGGVDLITTGPGVTTLIGVTVNQ